MSTLGDELRSAADEADALDAAVQAAQSESAALTTELESTQITVTTLRTKNARLRKLLEECQAAPKA